MSENTNQIQNENIEYELTFDDWKLSKACEELRSGFVEKFSQSKECEELFSIFANKYWKSDIEITDMDFSFSSYLSFDEKIADITRENVIIYYFFFFWIY
jgi:hypothetical protein